MQRLTTALLALVLLTACHQEHTHQDATTPVRTGPAPKAVTAQPTIAPQAEEAGCEKGVRAAQADEKNGTIGYYFWGIAIPPAVHTLETKYGFKVYTRGCVVTAEEGRAWSCYNQYMDGVIKQKYKQDVITMELTKAHEQMRERLRQREKNAAKKS